MTDRRDDDELADALGRALTPAVPPLERARLEAVRAEALRAASAGGAPTAPAADPGPGRTSRRSLLRLGFAAAGGIAAGATGAFLLDEDVAAPSAPVTETAAVVARPGVTASAEMIDHTWGLEVILDVDGLEPGAGYEMVFVGRDDRRVSAGGFVGTGEPMRCRNNGALLRADTARFVVTGPDGDEVLGAELS